MRRVLALVFVLATIVVLPAAPAAAQDERFEIVVVTEEYPAGITADGATLTIGSYVTFFEGIPIEFGTVEGRYYDRGTGVHGTRHFVDGITGATGDTEVKVLVTNVDDTGPNVIVDYIFEEEITAHSVGITGHGRGVAQLTAFPDGSFVLNTTLTAIIDLP